jgi:hypothetical protein
MYIINKYSVRTVVITTFYGLDGLKIESQWGVIFRAVNTDCETNLAFCTAGSGYFIRVKGEEAWCWVANGMELCLHLSYALELACRQMTFAFTSQIMQFAALKRPVGNC